MRKFHSQLDYLKQGILMMGHQVETVIEEMMVAFQTFDLERMDSIIEGDVRINQLELDLHDQVTLLISKQQPVATDLRKLIVALKISGDLERVADLVVDIAKQSSRLKSDSLPDYKQQLIDMFQIAQSMIQQALVAYEKSDVLMAQKLALLDDKVDTMYGQFIRELFALPRESIEIDQVTQMAFVGRYLERIADYATNVSEWVVYEVNGKHFDLN
ncbi:phosphate signaling complex protein PhoU [Halalkalibacterium halodurans]|jgi:phosphate transport system protein|nr:phosphate signaling complex protein PhoU [Halalkalibacterium halodurans]MDY7223535.1 phosphate signaling complex protein PhoU [Halalkalibacterium halodurans]MDY7242756.1 phosphate signaling complex protein PhoU [Halalkalibacterium halodurans]MED3646555.1 phosphate signaling complex protein PhoU [Halalkalibacterium halodurans]MED4082806.1 phosphate signaling complex protein PhoU [Halalkalibacterium halodurans]MED4085965.1 phosphate signaling complex protein PhoU [Halalkalibacterium haloduran